MKSSPDDATVGPTPDALLADVAVVGFEMAWDIGNVITRLAERPCRPSCASMDVRSAASRQSR